MLGCGDAEYGYEGDDMITGWSKTDSLIAHNTRKRFSLQASFEREGASAFTIMFESYYPPQQAGVWVAAKAKITWSVEGNAVERIVSVRNGLSITGVGEHVVVEVFDDSRSLTVGGAILPINRVEYQIAINIAPGTRGAALIGPTIIPWVLSPTALPVVQNYGSIMLIPGVRTTATIDLTDYPSVSAFLFSVGAGGWDVVLDNDVIIQVGSPLGTTTWVGAGSKDVWIPIQSSESFIYIEENPALLTNRLVTVTLAVDG